MSLHGRTPPMARGVTVRAIFAFLVVLLSAVLAGCSDGPEPLPPEWKGRDLRQPGWTNTTLEPEWTLVLEYPLPSGAELDWNWFTADERPLYFQLVRMENNQPVKMFGRHSAEEDASITTPKPGAYQLIWMTDAFFPQSFTWTAREGFSQTLYPPNEGPGCQVETRSANCLLPVLPPDAPRGLAPTGRG